MTEKPPWRVAIEQFERSIGAPLEEFMKSDEFADMAANAAKSQTQMQREVVSSTNQWLHAMNLPSATDIAEVRAEIAELRAEIAELRKEVRVLAQDVKPPAKKPSTARARSTKRAQDHPGQAAKRTQTAKSRAKPK